MHASITKDDGRTMHSGKGFAECVLGRIGQGMEAGFTCKKKMKNRKKRKSENAAFRSLDLVIILPPPRKGREERRGSCWT